MPDASEDFGLRIIVDTREQKPYQFGIHSEHVKLDTGDYSVKNYEALVAVERKSLEDLFRCLTTDRMRFKDQLIRLGALPYKALVIDANLDTLLMGTAHSAYPGAEALIRLVSMCARVGVPFHFAGGKGAILTGVLLREFVGEAASVWGVQRVLKKRKKKK